MQTLPLLDAEPWYFREYRAWHGRGWRGAYAIYRLLRRLGLLDRCAPFPLGDDVVHLPLTTTSLENPELFEIYEREALLAVLAAAAEFTQPPILVDCGADIGVYSRLLLYRGLRPAHLFCVEPNSRSYAVLEHNLRRVNVPRTLFHGGLADRAGFGALETPEYDSQDRAGFVRPGDGDVELTTADRLLEPFSGRPLVLKIDVEGAELDVLRGAARSLAQAPGFVVQFEAHPTVATRNGADPIECLQFLIDAGARSWVCCEEASGRRFEGLRPDTPFYAQMPTDRILDVVVSTSDAALPDRLA